MASAAPPATAAPALAPTWTVAPPTPTLAPPPTPAQIPTADTARQLRVFGKLWDAVNLDYVYVNFNGADWDAIGDKYHAQVEAGLSDEDFWQAMDAMVGELGDDHSGFQSPDDVAEEEAANAGHNDYVGIGILHMPLPEKHKTVILVIFPGSPAEAAGLHSHDSLLAVDGGPALDAQGHIRDAIRGPEGTTVTLTVQTPGQPARDVTVVRRRITGAVPIEHRLVHTPTGQRIGYVLVPTFTDLTIPEQVETALRELNAEAPLDGLILDNRVNEGGIDTALRGVLAFFTDGVMGHFISRIDQRPLTIAANDVAGSQAAPLVVLVGKGTVSFGEIFAGILQDIGRAQIVGEATEGNVEILWPYDFEDGSRAWIARETFRPLHRAAGWEGKGVVPDVSAPAEWDEITPEDDPGVAAAVKLLGGS